MLYFQRKLRNKKKQKTFAVFENLGVLFVHVPLAQNHIHVPLFISQTNVCQYPAKRDSSLKIKISPIYHSPLCKTQTRFLNHVTLLEFYSWKRAPPSSRVATESGGVGGVGGGGAHNFFAQRRLCRPSMCATVQFDHTHKHTLTHSFCSRKSV